MAGELCSVTRHPRRQLLDEHVMLSQRPVLSDKHNVPENGERQFHTPSAESAGGGGYSCLTRVTTHYEFPVRG